MTAPPDSNVPSLMNASEIDNPQITARAFGRKRGSFGAARGDFLLPQGRSVAGIVESIVASAFRQRGYAVVHGPTASPGETSVQVKIEELWSYFRPGAFQVAVHFIARLEIEAELPGWNGPLEVVVEDELRKGAVTDARWIALVERGLGALETRLAQQLRLS